ncbi:CAP domain-containing protein [Arenibacter sp. GZD96]|uniref:CAP domain-containing protein n=1 Tax=Aurantibrevibacter litoralis TaxID=3106030 RepID=UPI002AFECDB1|nr:CAP domain-containing protein [Arenibacter sp. GZD-96]MEA1786555.1 CAP domain-containing protein [Arenibacter sp. GZD-96]
MKVVRHILSLMIFFMFGSCSTEPVESVATLTAVSAPDVEKELLDIVNMHRVSSGVQALTFSATAYEYASAHTDYMISRGSISHDNFNSRAEDLTAEVHASEVSENVAKDYDSAVEAFTNWMNSPSHRKAIEGQFTHTAVSIKKDAEGNFYFTQLFYR